MRETLAGFRAIRVDFAVFPIFRETEQQARVAKLVDALDLGSSGVTCESSSLSSRTN
jgi:hypothetical protein